MKIAPLNIFKSTATIFHCICKDLIFQKYRFFLHKYWSQICMIVVFYWLLILAMSAGENKNTYDSRVDVSVSTSVFFFFHFHYVFMFLLMHDEASSYTVPRQPVANLEPICGILVFYLNTCLIFTPEVSSLVFHLWISNVDLRSIKGNRLRTLGAMS